MQSQGGSSDFRFYLFSVYYFFVPLTARAKRIFVIWFVMMYIDAELRASNVTEIERRNTFSKRKTERDHANGRHSSLTAPESTSCVRKKKPLSRAHASDDNLLIPTNRCE